MVQCDFIENGKKCTTRAFYGYHDVGKYERCKVHKVEGMVSLAGKRCIVKGCTKHASYGSECKKEYCAEHKTEEMTNTAHKLCAKEGCTKQPIFNTIGEDRGKYCNDHKKEGMIDIRKNKCEKCSTRASYGYGHDGKMRFCIKHKNNKCVDLVHAKCAYFDNDSKQCDVRPTFNKIGEIIGKYCLKHKEEGMVNVVDKKCIHIDENGGECLRQRMYGTETDRIPLYCFIHRKEDMINVKQTYCQYLYKDGSQCTGNRYYNYKGEPNAKFCSLHKKRDMVDVRHAKCKFIDNNDVQCSKYPSYNFKGSNTAIYCLEHAEKGMIDVLVRKCKSEFCDSCANKHYDNYCCHCFTNLFPTDPRSFKSRTANKEIKVKGYLYKNGYDNFIHNKPIYTGDCGLSKRRIDLYKYIGDKHILCVEVDERQHKYYDHDDEKNRYHDLYVDGYYMIYIRFNPDEYFDNNGRKKRTPFFNDRLPILLNNIKYIEENLDKYSNPDQLVYIEHLFYDGYSSK